MSAPRAAQAATLLPSGQVLVAGGFNGFIAGVGGSHTSLGLAELFDASTDTWTKAAPMLIPRSSPTATRLLDGRVLLVGGGEAPHSAEAGATAEIFDPSSNTWSPVPVPEELQEASSATLLPSGWVFLMGWFGAREYGAIQGGALYDSASGAWERTAAPKHPRQGAATVLLANGDVLMIGGWTSEARFPPVETVYTVLPAAEEYDPTTNEWIEVAAMKQPRGAVTATSLANGSVFVSGGVNEVNDFVGLSYSAVSSTEAYDPTTNSWTALAPMAIARERHTATLLPDGEVLVAGGGDCGSGACLGFGGSGDCCGASSAELYDPSTNTWSFTAPVVSGVEHTATLLPGGDVLITGGNLEPINMYELSNATIFAPSYPPDEPNVAAGPNSIASTTVTAGPAITDIEQTHRVWREGNALAHSSDRRSKPPVGTTFSFALNEKASVTLTFTQRRMGRKVKGRCVAAAERDRHKPTCERVVVVGVLSSTGRNGANEVVFQGRISRSKKLEQGSYALFITATSSTGARTVSKPLSFTIVR